MPGMWRRPPPSRGCAPPAATSRRREAGRADAANFLAQVAPDALPDATVTVDRSATSVTVKVHASVMSVIPFGDFSVDESAAGPVELYVGTR